MGDCLLNFGLGQSTRSESIKIMNNENKQNQTGKIDPSLGRRVIDELLALKEEMAERIENTITLVEQNFDHRLENAILFLAGYGDSENLEDSIGFNESDSRFAHSLLMELQSGAMLTVKQAETALQMMQKYSQTQLEPNGYSLPRTWEEISHQYRERTIKSDAFQTLMVLQRDEDRGMYITILYNSDHYYIDIETYIGDDDHALQTTEETLEAAGELIGNGFDLYVDPDIEAAYYLWQQEQKAETGSGQISALLNNENKQNQTHKIDSFLGWKNIDELLAFKEEMAGRIEEIIARIEQNLDRRLEDAILFLAGACDDESAQEVMGFNESDSRFGHYLARWLQSGEKLTLKQAEAALQMMQKYSQCQLEPNGYSLPTAWEEISHQYRERTIEIDLVGHFFGCLEDSILFLARYDGDDDMGFNESDSRFGHYLAGWLQRGEQLTLKQAEAALGMMQKYRQSQLEPNDYSLPTAWEYISHNYLTIGGDPPALSAVLKTGQRFVLRTGEYCDTFIALHYPNPNLREILGEYFEDIWDWEESFTHNVLLDAAPRLMDAVAYYREYGYATYVDPDIEAAIYLWQQERQRMVSDREPVLPLYALPPDVLLLDTVPLESEKGIDYQGLRRLLQQQEWYSAD